MKREHIVEIARSWLFTPYKHQATVKGAGCDCVGLLRGVFKELYGLDDDPEVVPPYRPDWYERTERDNLLLIAGRHLEEVSLEERRAGDVLCFRMRPGMSAKHCAIMTGPNSMIHSYSRKFVVEVTMGKVWEERLVAVFRFPGVED